MDGCGDEEQPVETAEPIIADFRPVWLSNWIAGWIYLSVECSLSGPLVGSGQHPHVKAKVGQLSRIHVYITCMLLCYPRVYKGKCKCKANIVLAGWSVVISSNCGKIQWTLELTRTQWSSEILFLSWHFWSWLKKLRWICPWSWNPTL